MTRSEIKKHLVVNDMSYQSFRIIPGGKYAKKFVDNGLDVVIEIKELDSWDKINRTKPVFAIVKGIDESVYGEGNSIQEAISIIERKLSGNGYTKEKGGNVIFDA